MLAIVETCGKQYQLQEGRYVDFEYLGQDVNSKVEFDKVVMIVAGDKSKVGQPYVEGAKIAGTVMLNAKNQKVLVYKQRCKKGYRKKQGHRQMFSRVMIDSISFPGREEFPAEATEVKAEAKTTKKAATKKATAKTTEKKASSTTAKKTTSKKTTAKKAEAKTETKAEVNAETKTEE